MPFEELVAGLDGKMLLAATNVFDRKKSTLYIFDGKDTKRIQDILAAERAYVEKKKKGHSLSRLFKKNGVSFESVAVPIEHIIVWDREEETPEAADPVGEKIVEKAPYKKTKEKEKGKREALAEWIKSQSSLSPQYIPNTHPRRHGRKLARPRVLRYSEGVRLEGL